MDCVGKGFTELKMAATPPYVPQSRVRAGIPRSARDLPLQANSCGLFQKHGRTN
jgi:hypothetical protein